MRTRTWLGALVAAGAAFLSIGDARASSHREAPFIARMPKVDNTDLYMFRSYQTGKEATVTIIANFQPLQDSYGGPNYFTMDPDALYEIHVDNTGDAVEDLTFQFRFQNLLNDAVGGGTGFALDVGTGANKKSVSIPFYNANVDGVAIDQNNQFGAFRRNVKETYTMKVVRGARRTGAVADVSHAGGPGDPGATFIKPMDFVGTKSFGNTASDASQNAAAVAAYASYADAHVYDASIPAGAGACAGGSGVRVFVGQRQEGFPVLLGNIFDMVNATAGQLTLGDGGRAAFPFYANPIGNKNVSTIALEIPVACLKGAGDVIGAWSTASVRQARAINPKATYLKPSREGGAWAQVSRLGNPLVNEVVIGLKDKDRFNSTEPTGDAIFADYVTNPTLPAVLEALFGPTVRAPTAVPRGDLVTAFLKGVPTVNEFGPAGGAEMLRLNVNQALPVTARGSQVYLGAAGCFKPGATAADAKVLDLGLGSCDPQGFPNGRRPGDDVVDIALRVAMGYLLSPNDAPSTDVPLGDAITSRDTDYLDHFPYLNPPNPGAQAIP